MRRPSAACFSPSVSAGVAVPSAPPSTSSSGTTSSKEEPRPTSLRTLTEPPWASATAFTIASPNPKPPVALAMSKFVVQNSLNKPYVEHLAFQNLGMLINQTFASHDIAEGGRAFREKRKPQFRGPLSGEE